MPMWPFGRRSGRGARPKGRSAAVSDSQDPVSARAHEFASSDALGRDSPPTRHRSRRRRASASASASASADSMRDVEKSSPEHGYKNKARSQPVRRLSHASDHSITALPNQKQLEHSPHLRAVSQQHVYAYRYNFQQPSHSHSHASLPTARDRGRLQRPQSLRRPANESALVRRKSSKKQKREHDHIREEEIRAMSMPMPQKRPAGSSGGMLRRDSKKVKGLPNRRFERPTSDVSLPLQDSIHSSMSGSSDPRAFRVSALDMFSPRPTIRCSVGTQYYYSHADTSPTPNKGRREAYSVHANNKEMHDRRTSRIDDLADELDAGALREIMDRDQRRRDKKRKQDDERLRRRLERRAAKQKALEAGVPPATPRQAARPVGLGIEKDTSSPMEDVRPSTPQRPQPIETASFDRKTHGNSQLPTPLDSPVEEAVVSNARAIRYSRGSVSGPHHSRGPSNVSQMPELLSEKYARSPPMESVEQPHDPTASGSLHAVETIDTAAASRKSPSRRRSSEGRRLGVFASLFRRSKRNSQDQGRTTPSEVSFSNTSRESMSRHAPPAHLAAALPTQPIPIKRPSSVPKRTMSKFREDLPEYPLSPPDSRMQSPETNMGSAIAARRRSQQPADLRVESRSSGTGARTDSPVSPGVPNAGLMSQSLASVDSEGSWLSGKPMNRRSNRSHFRTSVGSSSALKRNEDFNASYEELGVPDDEYFKRLTPQPDSHRASPQPNELVTKASSTAMALNDADALDEDVPLPSNRESEEEEQVHTVARQPTVVHRQPRVKSTEGLLSFFQAEKDATGQAEEQTATIEQAEADSPTSEHEMATVSRAKSVDFGKNHMRHLSAGSAKLLDIQKRASQSKSQQR